ncbi:unnamed protein product, partial [Rotaria sp. Silwood2]
MPTRNANIDLSPTARWSPNGITVAGGHGKGCALNQLSTLEGLYVDEDQTVYVTDNGNNRIVSWSSGAIVGQVIAGGNGRGDRLDQLNKATDIIVDRISDNLLICDRGNNRLVRWPRGGGT